MHVLFTAYLALGCNAGMLFRLIISSRLEEPLCGDVD